MSTLIRLLAVVLAPLLLLAACGSDDEKPKTTTLGSITYADHGTKDVKGKAGLELEADSFYFSPTFVRGTAGQKLTLKIENESKDQHNLSLAAQQIDTDIPPKGKVTVEVTIPPSGVVRFFCKYHTDRGMNGELLSGDATPQPAP
jgi:plastocyanin